MSLVGLLKFHIAVEGTVAMRLHIPRYQGIQMTRFKLDHHTRIPILRINVSVIKCTFNVYLPEHIRKQFK